MFHVAVEKEKKTKFSPVFPSHDALIIHIWKYKVI